jgi:hypothetical protein
MELWMCCCFRWLVFWLVDVYENENHEFLQWIPGVFLNCNGLWAYENGVDVYENYVDENLQWIPSKSIH